MIRNPINAAFGQAIAQRRDELGITQVELASQVGMSRASIANIEKGRQNVLLHHIYDLADALKMPKAGDLLPRRAKISSDRVAVNVTLGDLSDVDTAQISDFVSSVLASHKVGGKR